jgi:outer membrane protein insertion porin family
VAEAIWLDWLTRFGQGGFPQGFNRKGISRVTSKQALPSGRRIVILAMLCSAMPVMAAPAKPAKSGTRIAIPAAPAAPAPAAAPADVTPVIVAAPKTIRTINVTGAQRLEADTVRSYIQLRAGGPYTTESLDQAIRDLFDTDLFQDVQIRDDSGALTIEIRENPVINRIILEGNKRIKEDKITKEIKLAPRQIFSRSKVRADVARIAELYRRQGRFAANIEPKMVQLDQNRVDVVFEITEGPKSKVRQINVLGNHAFSDAQIRGTMATKQSRWTGLLSSKDSYDPDKLAYDQAKLRQFYLTNGYADFRVVSAVAELTPDKRDFIITYVIEEGERYKFGDIAVESELRDFKPNVDKLPIKKGAWYNAKLVEDTVESLTESAGLFGYAFAEINPDFQRDKETKTMSLTVKVADTPRVYIEQININGNTITQDKVVRREFRVAEGDAFNSFQVKRSSDRIQSLGYFQEKLEIEQKPGSAPDRIVLEANVEEKSTGELQLSAGFSSLERFILNASIRQRNFRGKGQELRASVNYSSYSKSVELGFTEPYLFDKNIALGFDVFRRDYNSFQFNGTQRQTTYQQTTTGFQFRVGVPLTEYWSLAGRYGLNIDDVTLDQSRFYFNGLCDPLLAGRYLCDAVGKRTTSTIGYSLVFDNLNNRIRPSGGQRMVFSQDFAGLGGSVKYLRTRLDAAKYWKPFGNFIFSAAVEGGYIIPFEQSRGPGIDKVRLTDRFFLGEPELRGFDIRGVGPRVKRIPYNTLTGALVTDVNSITDDALGGRAYYKGRLELEIPLGSGAKELGIRPSIFLDVGAVFGVTSPSLTRLTDFPSTTVTNTDGTMTTTYGPQLRPFLDAGGGQQCIDNTTSALTSFPVGGCATGTTFYANTIAPFDEQFLGNSWKPRLSVGFGFNWKSPFGPFRIDIAKALLTQPGDNTKLFTFNVGTQF